MHATALIASLILGPSPFVVPPPANQSTSGTIEFGACQSMASGQVCCFDYYGAQCGWPTTDVAPLSTYHLATSASPLGSGSTTGAKAIIAGGSGTHTLTCVQTNCGAGDTVNVVVDGVTKTCTRDAALNDSTHFTCGASNAAMCTNVAACLATATGVNACAGSGCTLFTGASGVAYVYRDSTEPGGMVITVGSSGDHATVVNGTDGGVELATATTVDKTETVTGLATLNGGLTLGAASPLVTASCTVTVADSGNGSPATATLTPTTCSYVELTCSDADGCTMTLGESGASDGMQVTIVNVSANTATFSNTATVSELNGNFPMVQHATLTLTYETDRWVERSRKLGASGVAATMLGKNGTASHSETTGDAIAGGILTAKGAFFADSTAAFAGVASFATGSAASPSITFSADSNKRNGLYYVSAETWGIASQGTQIMQFNGGNPVDFRVAAYNASSSGTPEVMFATGSGATTPVFLTTRGDSTTGIGGAANTLAEIVGGTAMIVSTSTVNTLNGTVVHPAEVKDVGTTCTAGETMIDNGGATVEICVCTATNTIRCVATTTTNPLD